MSTAYDVVLAALAQPLPPVEPERPQTEARARLVVAALIAHGHLPDPNTDTEPSLADVEAQARWLAAASRHPRYLVEDGWRKVMASDADVNVAAAAAAKYALHLRDRQEAIDRAVAILTHWQTTHPEPA